MKTRLTVLLAALLVPGLAAAADIVVFDLARVREVAKVQGGDTPKGMPRGLAKGGTRVRVRQR